MTQEEMNRAYNWFQKHRKHCYQLAESAQDSYMPTEEDCAHPELWKPSHWRWFISELTE